MNAVNIQAHASTWPVGTIGGIVGVAAGHWLLGWRESESSRGGRIGQLFILQLHSPSRKRGRATVLPGPLH